MNILTRGMRSLRLLRNISKTAVVGGSCIGLFSMTSVVYMQHQQWHHPWILRNHFGSTISASSLSNTPLQYPAARHMNGQPDETISDLRLKIVSISDVSFLLQSSRLFGLSRISLRYY